MGVSTLDDLSATGATVATRIDINSPLTPDKALADDARLRAHVDTLDELLDRDAKVAVLAHQGRPGGDEFGPLQPHADRLGDLLAAPVAYCDATFSADARSAVTTLEPGTAVVLENTRFYSEEYMEFEPERAADTYLVDRLAPVFDAFVNDAFAAAHRSQPSLVGFTEHLPSYAGRVMERELDILGNIDATPTPRVYVLGGAKVEDSIHVAEHVLANDLADTILTTGVVANVFLTAAGTDLGSATNDYLDEHVADTHIDAAADVLAVYGDDIQLPTDVAVDRNATRHELSVTDLPAPPDQPIKDIGTETIHAYEDTLANAGTAILNGPAGVIEDDEFTAGTKAIFEATTHAEYSIVGGGDTAAAIRRFGIDGFDHISTGGGAALRLLCGEPLPAVESLS